MQIRWLESCIFVCNGYLYRVFCLVHFPFHSLVLCHSIDHLKKKIYALNTHINVTKWQMSASTSFPLKYIISRLSLICYYSNLGVRNCLYYFTIKYKWVLYCSRIKFAHYILFILTNLLRNCSTFFTLRVFIKYQFIF